MTKRTPRKNDTLTTSSAAAPAETGGVSSLTALLHSKWRGGVVVQAGLSNPAAAIELSRRGARVIGFDADASAVERAAEANRLARGAARFECQAGASWAEKLRAAADVVYVETLGAGGEATLTLEAAFSKAPCIVVPAEAAARIPDRFASLRQAPGAAGFGGEGYCVLTDERVKSAPPVPSLAFLEDGPAPNATRKALRSGLELAAGRCLAAGPARRASVVLDPGMRPSGMDAGILAHRDVDGPASIVWTSTRTDRFSREHVSVLRAFDQAWVPCASARKAALQSGLDACQVHIVPPAVDTARLQPATERGAGFKVLTIVSSPGRVAEALRAVRALAEELGANEDATLTIACAPGIDAEDLERQIDAILTKAAPAARERVQCETLAADSPAEELYTPFDLFLRPSTGESTGVAILEAMACGVPVAATRFGVSGEIVHLDNGYPIEIDGLAPCDPAAGGGAVDEAGHLRPVPNHESIRACLRQAYSDRTGLDARRNRARADVVLRNSPEAVSRALEALPFAVPAPGPVAAAPAVEPTSESRMEVLTKGLSYDVELALVEPASWTGDSLRAASSKREVWCGSPVAKENWITAGLTPSAIHVVPPSVRCDVFAPEQRPAVLPTRRRLRVLTYADTGLTSGADLAVRAFVEANVTRAALVVAGADEATKASLARLAASLDSGAEVVFVQTPAGDAARASLVNACDLFLDFSRGGSNGQGLLEAAACAKPALACQAAIPPGVLDGASGYPVAARVKMYACAVRQDGSAGAVPEPVFIEVAVSEAAATLRQACTDAESRRRKGLTARTRALGFQPSHLERWISERKRALASPPAPAPAIAVVVPSGTEICQLPDGARVVALEGERARGGLAVEASETIVHLTEDYAVVASGPLAAEARWIQRVVEPLQADPTIALGLAKDDHGALLVLRPSLLRRHAFATGFTSMAFLVDFARQVIQSGERVVPVAHVKLAFTPVTPVFAAESAAVSALAAAHEAFASGELEAGLDALETAMTAQPRYKAGLETTARFMASVNSPREELTSLTALVKLDARDANARARLGMVAMQLGETELGLTQLATAHALAPDDAAIATVYGQALLRCGKSDEAASMFLTALAASPQHVEAALGAADSLTRLGQSAEALELLRAFDTPAEAPEEALALG